MKGLKGNIPWNKKVPVVLSCKVCHQAFPVKPSVVERRKHCSRACLIVSRKGRIPWNKKEGVSFACLTCHKVIITKPSHAPRRIYCSRRCAKVGKPSNWKGRSPTAEVREKIRKAHLGRRGPAHWNWRGAARSERQRAMARDEYKQWRMNVFKRDGFTCQHCGATKVFLNAHHIQQWSLYPKLRYEVSNGLTLCVPCHDKIPRIYKKVKVQ